MSRTALVIGALSVAWLSLLSPKAEAQAQELSGAAGVCQGELLGAGVGAASRTVQLWIPQAREFNFHLGTTEFSIPIGKSGASFTLPALTVFATRQTGIWDGFGYRGISRTNTFGPWTWTDVGRTVRGVCISYDSAVDAFISRR